ncbi:hypothetical protein IWW50_004744 [Coemansia erecta]|nr:hypothetical protein IWW50_004744 [Coemansia erecta]
MAAYYIEILDNLHVVDIYAEYGKLQLVNDSNVEIGEQLSVKLPVATIPHSATRTTLSCAGSKQVNWTRIRVPIAHSSRQQRQSTVSRNITDIGNPVAAASIEGLEDICCRACGAHMLSSGLKSADYRPNVRNLPSAHWSELVDCWVCHPEEDNLRVNPDLMHSFEPEKNTPAATDAQAANTEPSSIVKDDVHVWVGNTFILVSTACLKSVHSKHVPLDAKVSLPIWLHAIIDVDMKHLGGC